MSYPPPSDPNQPQPPQYGQEPPQYGQAPPPYSPQGYGQPPMQQPVQKSKTGLVIGIVLGVILLICVVCGGGAWYFFYKAEQAVTDIVDNIPTVFPTGGSETGTPHTVVYEINGSGKALITWARGGGGTDSETADLPWRKELTVNRSSFGLTVFAFPRDGGSADSCKITVDGQERATKQGQSGVVTCTATIVN